MIEVLLIGFLNIFRAIFPNVTQGLSSGFSSFTNEVNQVAVYLASFLNLCVSGFWWIIDALMIPRPAVTLMITVLLMKMVIPVIAATIKLILRWYTALMPTK